ncbi:MAG: SpoIIE family protein phosphatase [Leptospirales bacterium]|nr:SpoIIE family protein phosphatase [Leptospirales bacterium]
MHLDFLQLSANFFERFTPSVLTFILASFLLSRRQTVARYLGAFFLFLTVFNAGYLLGYSGIHAAAPYGFHLACFITLALVFKIQFAYRMPVLIFRRESIVVFFLTMAVSIAATVEYTLSAEAAGYRLIFDQHILASRYASTYVPSASMIMFVWVAIVQLRHINHLIPSPRWYEFKGVTAWLRIPLRLLLSPVVPITKIFKPGSAQAKAVRSFFFLVLAELAINIVVLVGFLTSFVSKEVVSLLLNTGLLFVYFWYGMVYINHSRESTSLMIRLVAISLVTLLVVTGLIGSRANQRAETSFDAEHKGPLPGLAKAMSENKDAMLTQVPDQLQYVAFRPGNSRFSQDYRILFERSANPSPSAMADSDAETRDYDLLRRANQLKREKRTTDDVARTMASNELDQQNIDVERRLYRTAGGVHYLYYVYPGKQGLYEFGFFYSEYRSAMHQTVTENVVIVFVVTILILSVFPLLFRVNLIAPLNLLLTGVARVEHGDMSHEVPVQIQDEIGFLARAFNEMVKSIRDAQARLKDYAETLETKVKDRTRELQRAYDNLDELKRNQDGDYFLTSMLIDPLARNGGVSENIAVDFLVEQKKKFEFKKWKAEIGGDMNISDRIMLRGKTYTVVLNADAMGKSIQGGGGILVLGSLLHAILNRTKSGAAISDYTPERWLNQTFAEMDSVYRSFNASMLVSLVLLLIDEQTGLAYYLAAEHPLPVLLREGQAVFLEYPHALNKLGTPGVDVQAFIETVPLKQGDRIILGSDGRDDLMIPADNGQLRMNEDYDLFCSIVQSACGDLIRIRAILGQTGEIVDDLSLASISILRLSERTALRPKKLALKEQVKLKNWKEGAPIALSLVSEEPGDLDFFPVAARICQKAGAISQAIDLLESYWLRRPQQSPSRLTLAGLYHRIGKPDRAAAILAGYTEIFPDDPKAAALKALLIRANPKPTEN